MNRLTQFFAFLVFFSLILTTACKKESTNRCGDNFNYALELQAEANGLSAAASVYANDPTTENCEAYKAAVQAYLDAAEDLDDCVLASERAAYQQAIDEARDNLNNLQC